MTQRIENYPGIPEPISGAELLEILRRQAIQFGAEYVQAQVTGVDLLKDPKEIFSSTGTFYGRTVIIATGAMEHMIPSAPLTPNRLPSYPILSHLPHLPILPNHEKFHQPSQTHKQISHHRKLGDGDLCLVPDYSDL